MTSQPQDSLRRVAAIFLIIALAGGAILPVPNMMAAADRFQIDGVVGPHQGTDTSADEDAPPPDWRLSTMDRIRPVPAETTPPIRRLHEPGRVEAVTLDLPDETGLGAIGKSALLMRNPHVVPASGSPTLLTLRKSLRL